MRKLIIDKHIFKNTDKELKREKDSFDSLMSLNSGNEKLDVIVNVNPASALEKTRGEIACGNYIGIVYNRAETSYRRGITRRSLMLFKREILEKLQIENGCIDERQFAVFSNYIFFRQFESIKNNAAHGNKKIISHVLIHSDFENGGASEGCITSPSSLYTTFMENAKLKHMEVVEIKIINSLKK